MVTLLAFVLLRVTAFVMLLLWLTEHAPGLFWPVLLFGLSSIRVSLE